MNMHNVLYSLYRYFCGHDHDIQHIKEQNDTVNYFVSGAGHLTNSSVANEVAKYTYLLYINVIIFNDRTKFLQIHCCTDTDLQTPRTHMVDSTVSVSHKTS